MPVYLVSMRRSAQTKDSTVLQEWCEYVKGWSDHVELAFVNQGRPVKWYRITHQTRASVFGTRPSDAPSARAVATWYALPSVDEAACEAHCASRGGQDVMSLVKMTRSAMPFRSTAIARALTPLLAGLSAAECAKEAAEGEKSAFCSSITLRALMAGAPGKLDDVDVDACTAQDVVALARLRLGATRVLDASRIPGMPRGSEVLSSTFVRSDRWGIV